MTKNQKQKNRNSGFIKYDNLNEKLTREAPKQTWGDRKMNQWAWRQNTENVQSEDRKMIEEKWKAPLETCSAI